MTLHDLSNKYDFNLTRLARKARLSLLTVRRFFEGGSVTIKTASAIINVMPITPDERAALIESLFEPKA